MIYDTYIDKLLENNPHQGNTEEMDLVLDTGAFNGIYLYGALLYLSELEKRKTIKIGRVSGASIGAICGMLFIFNRLEAIDEFYEQIRKTIRKEGYLESYKDVLKKFFSNLPDDEFKKLNGRLYINYQCTKTKKQIVIKEYDSNDDVIEKLYKSSFLPFIMNGKLETEGYIDGINPYIFEERSKEDKKILYLNLLSISRVKSILNTKYDKNTSCRALTGILETHDFFTNKTPNTLCSYVNDWKIDRIMLFRGRELFCFLVVSLISVMVTILKQIPSNLNDINFLKTLSELLCKFYKESIVYIMFDM